MTATAGPDPEPAVDAVAGRAQEAFALLSQADPGRRADALRRAAVVLGDHADELVATAQDETGLAEARLRGELRRTQVQLRLFARTVADGAYLDVRLDEADPDFVLGPRPDLRRVLWPVGPVLNFAASNFPFAFSVAGGDTAAALAAGCPVIVKAHPGHPRLSERVAELVAAALVEAGLPEHTLQLVTSQEAGVALVEHPAVRAAAFTGSQRVGQLLAARAAARPDPIPFFGELGSVNPVVVSREALEERAGERAGELLAGYVASVSGSAGQLCTKPGFLLVPAGTRYDDAVIAAASAVPEHRLLNPSIAAGYERRVAEVLSVAGVRVVHAGGSRRDGSGDGSVAGSVGGGGQAWVTPTFVSVPLDVLRSAGPALLDEVFGPFSVIVEYPDGTDLAGVVAELFPGSLTLTLHLGSGETRAEQGALVSRLARHAGRILLGGWPTGVAVTPAMQHGGPWPATTTDGTSVGTAAIGRFLRGVAFQDSPQDLLPPPLRDDNPWGVPRTVSARGESLGW